MEKGSFKNICNFPIKRGVWMQHFLDFPQDSIESPLWIIYFDIQTQQQP